MCQNYQIEMTAKWFLYVNCVTENIEDLTP